MHDVSPWMTASLAQSPQARRLLFLVAAALDAVEPAKAVQRWLAVDQAGLWVAADCFVPRGGTCGLIAVGKAALPMARAVIEMAGELVGDGLVVTRAEQVAACGHLSVLAGGHPLPDASSLAAAAALETIIRPWASRPGLVLLSGGASALLAAPWPGLTLDDLEATTDALLLAGVPIEDFNLVRKHLERFKGGRLAAALSGPVCSLILSDVVNSPLDVIASGPTVPDPSTFAEALAIIAGLESRLPAQVVRHLKDGAMGLIPETPKPTEPFWKRTSAHVIGSHRDAVQAAAQAAQRQGWNVVVVDEPLVGEARRVGQALAQRCIGLAQTHRPMIVIASGETTVTITHPETARHGGGRNQELALAAALELEGVSKIAFLAIATDGIDGPTSAAGAVATGETLARAEALGVDARQCLDDHQSHRFWLMLGDAFLPGPTNTNVNDVVIVAAW